MVDGAPDINNHLITGSQAVISRGSQVFIGFESQSPPVEDIVAEDKLRGLRITLFRRSTDGIFYHIHAAGRKFF